MFLQPYHRCRTFYCTVHLHVPLAISMLQNLCTHVSYPCFSNHTIATEPCNAQFISLFLQPHHRYRTLQCTVHLFVSPAAPSLQNLTMHSSSPCFSNHNIATEPFHPHSMPPVQKPLPSKKEAFASFSIFSIYPIFPAPTKESNDRFHFLDWSGCCRQ